MCAFFLGAGVIAFAIFVVVDEVIDIHAAIILNLGIISSWGRMLAPAWQVQSPRVTKGRRAIGGCPAFIRRLGLASGGWGIRIVDAICWVVDLRAWWRMIMIQ